MNKLGGKFTLWYNLACLSPSNKNCFCISTNNTGLFEHWVVDCWQVRLTMHHMADLTFDWLFLKNYFHPWLGLQEKNQSTFSRGMPTDSLALLLLIYH